MFGGSCHPVLVVNNGEGEDCIAVGDWVKMLDGVRLILSGSMRSRAFPVCNVFGAVTSLRVVTGESMLRL